MRVFECTVMFIVFGIIFLVIFGVSVFLVNINHDFLMPFASGVDSRFAQTLNMFQSAIMLMGVLMLIVGIISYFVGMGSEEPDEYFRGNP